jgi:hypothetical protein
MDWVGKEVTHRRWGKGIVIDQRYGGTELRIEYKIGLLWHRSSEVTLVKPNDTTPPITTPPLPTKQPSIESVPPILDIQLEKITQDTVVLDELRAVEAFKLGVVPPTTRGLIFGRENEINRFKAWLTNERQNSLLVFGNYGSGKSYFLRCIHDIALENNYAVSLCSLDPTETPLTNPKAIYRAITQNFRYGKNRKNFRDFVTELKISKEKNNNHSTYTPFNLISTQYWKKRTAQSNNPYIDSFLHASMEDEFFWRWIEGDDTVKMIHGYPTIPPASTSSNIICSILSAFSYFLKTSIGVKGFLLLFDEAESINLVRSNIFQFQKQRNFLKGLKLTADANRSLIGEEIDKWSPRYGKNTGLSYSGRSPVQYLFNKNSAFKIVFAFTPDFELKQLCLELGFKDDINLLPLGYNDKTKVVSQIQSLFMRTTGKKISPEELGYINKTCIELSGDEIRTLVKSTVEALELRTHYPDNTIQELLS